jgi:hypothetical protein
MLACRFLLPILVADFRCRFFVAAFSLPLFRCRFFVADFRCRFFLPILLAYSPYLFLLTTLIPYCQHQSGHGA